MWIPASPTGFEQDPVFSLFVLVTVATALAVPLVPVGYALRIDVRRTVVAAVPAAATFGLVGVAWKPGTPLTTELATILLSWLVFGAAFVVVDRRTERPRRPVLRGRAFAIVLGAVAAVGTLVSAVWFLAMGWAFLTDAAAGPYSSLGEDLAMLATSVAGTVVNGYVVARLVAEWRSEPSETPVSSRVQR